MKSGDVEEKRGAWGVVVVEKAPAQQTPVCLISLHLGPPTVPQPVWPTSPLRGQPQLLPRPSSLSTASLAPPPPARPQHTAPALFPPLVSWLPCCWLSCRLHVLVTQWSPQRGPLLLTPPLALAPASPRSTLRTSPPSKPTQFLLPFPLILSSGIRNGNRSILLASNAC